MKWFEKAIGKEKILYMFNDDLDVNDNKVRMNIDGEDINIMCESDGYFIDEIEPELINLEESMN